MLFERHLPLVSDHVPLEDHVTDRACVLSDGGAYAMFEVDGIRWETAEPEEVSAWHSRLNLTVRNIASDQLILSVYQCRGLATAEAFPPGQHRPGFAAELAGRYRQRLLDRSLYSNRLFLALQLRPPRPAGEWVADQLDKRGRAKKRHPHMEAVREGVQRLEDICELVQAELAAYRPRRLGLALRGNGVFSEIGEALAFAATGVWRGVPLTTGRLGNTLLVEDVFFGHESIEMRGPGWTTCAAMLGMREFPAVTWPGLFGALLIAPFRYTLKQSFRCMGKAEGHGVLTRKQNKMLAAGDKAFSQIADLDQAADRLASNQFVMGDYCLALCVFADQAALLGDVATSAWKALGDSGVVVARETRALMAAWLSLLPGNHRLRVRPGAVSSRNFTAMAPLHAYPPGPAQGHWGAPIALLRTTGGTPYRFHWHVGDVGNALVTGETGSGKSLLIAFLMAMTAGRAGIIALDHKRGWELLIRAMGGEYAVLGAGQPHFAPLKALDASARNMEFLSELLRGCILMEGGGPLTPEEDRRLALGLEAVMSLPPAERGLGELRAFLGTDQNGAGARLEKWCWGSELGWVIDAPSDAIGLSGDLHGLDTTALLENPRARGPALLYLFHRIELRLDGRPLLIPTDEGWRALLDETFRPAIQRRLRTIRSFNGALVFITQSPADVLQSGIAAALIEQCPTQIHMPNPRASRSDYVEGLKRTPAEYEAVRALPKGSGLFLLCQGTESLVAQLPLHGMADEIAVLSGREETVRLLDAMPPEVKADPARMLAEFHRLRKTHRELLA